jgi:hypothetical protein
MWAFFRLGTENDQATGRVKLTARAAVFSNNKRPACLTGPLGAAWSSASPPTKPTCRVVGRAPSMDIVPIRGVELEPELGLPKPSTDWEETTYSFGFHVLVCHLCSLVIWMLSA